MPVTQHAPSSVSYCAHQLTCVSCACPVSKRNPLLASHMATDTHVATQSTDVQVRMLSERRNTLIRLTLGVCNISEHDPDVPLILDLRPLAQASPVTQ